RGADEKGSGTKLSLSSGYGQALLGGKTRWVHLSATVDDSGVGEGTLTLDPNPKQFSAYGEPTTPPEGSAREISITLLEIKGQDRPKDGRRLFALTGKGLDSRLSLVVPAKGTTTCRLISSDKAGKVVEVLLLEPEAGDGLPAYLPKTFKFSSVSFPVLSSRSV